MYLHGTLKEHLLDVRANPDGPVVEIKDIAVRKFKLIER